MGFTLSELGIQLRRERHALCLDHLLKFLLKSEVINACLAQVAEEFAQGSLGGGKSFYLHTQTITSIGMWFQYKVYLIIYTLCIFYFILFYFSHHISYLLFIYHLFLSEIECRVELGCEYKSQLLYHDAQSPKLERLRHFVLPQIKHFLNQSHISCLPVNI